MTTIWTIGYEHVGVPDFIAALKDAKIKTLVDVREVANSRRAGFSKKALMGSLADAGIGYIHLKPLGTPKAGREAARAGKTDVMHRIYEAKLVEPEAQMALAEVNELAGKGRVCLMCLEHNWRECHRAIICTHLEPLGVKAKHLAPEASHD
ncbi:MAG TPA: DUF488 domain-containing protein [Caulobacterales bacterium]|nr:DUF488 domain-containing protein [Caulobacterales bacterium]